MKISSDLPVKLSVECHYCDAVSMAEGPMKRLPAAKAALGELLAHKSWEPMKIGSRTVGVVCKSCLEQFEDEGDNVSNGLSDTDDEDEDEDQNVTRLHAD